MLFLQARKLFRIAPLSLAFWGIHGYAAGLGAVDIRSGLGQPLQATVSIVGSDTSRIETRCIKATVGSMDQALAIMPRIGLMRNGDSLTIQLSTRENVNEPILNILIEMNCDLVIRREYQVLLDPVVILPAVQKHVQERPATKSASTKKAAKHSAAGQSVRSRTHNNAATTPGSSSKKNATPRSYLAKESDQSVLKMARLDIPLETEKVIVAPPLKLSENLSLSNAESSPQKLAEMRIAQEQLAAMLRGEDPAEHAQALVQKLKSETDSLRAETSRAQRQKASQEAAQEQTDNWLKTLAAFLVLAVGAIGWLVWRMRKMKKNAAHTSWNELFPDTVDSSQLEGNTEFGTTVFNMASFNTSELADAASPTTTGHDIDTGNMPVQEKSDLAAEAPKFAQNAEKKKKGFRLFGAKEQVKEEEPETPYTYSNVGTTPFVYLNRAESIREDLEVPEQALKAEEISDVMELADAWMALQAPAKVLEILEPFSTIDQPESPLPWLCLLDVYRALGDQEKYEAILTRIKTIFNVKLSPWDQQPKTEGLKTLADYPHITARILDLWEGDNVVPFLEELLVDDRGGNREGFDLPVYRDIMRLITLAKAPDRLRNREQIMHEKAYAILFAQPSEKKDERPHSADSFEFSNTTPFNAPSRDTGRNAAAVHSQGLALVEPEEISGIEFEFSDARKDSATDPFAFVEPEKSSAAQHLELQKAAVATEDMSPLAIKLHLAIAYQDIGDKEGACLLLEEVMKEGTPEQAERAKAMLTKLAS